MNSLKDSCMQPKDILAQDQIGSKIEVLIALLYHNLLHPGDRAIDGGANSGLHTIPMARQVRPSGEVFAYEPQPAMLQRLSDWVSVEGLNAIVHERGVALGEVKGRGSFFVSQQDNALSSLDPAFAGEGHTEIPVEVVRLDDDIAEGEVSFIKLDLEGGEFSALRGGRALITRSRPVIVFEFARQFSAERFNFTREDFFSFFGALGYSLWDIFGQPMSPDTWDGDATAWEWIAGPVNDPRAGLINHIVDSYWAAVADRPPLEKWSEVVELVREPRQYYNPPPMP